MTASSPWHKARHRVENGGETAHERAMCGCSSEDGGGTRAPGVATAAKGSAKGRRMAHHFYSHGRSRDGKDGDRQGFGRP